MKGTRVPAVSCGIDWAEGHHDVAVVDEHGTVICAERIGNDAAGLARLLELLALHDPATGHLEVAIETSRGLLVAGLAGRRPDRISDQPTIVACCVRSRRPRGKSSVLVWR
jgi:hypothetical protein